MERITHFFNQLIVFTWLQVKCCIFPAAIFMMLAASKLAESAGFDGIPGVFGLPRYDALLVGCLLMQVFMVKSGLETKDELKVICLFHIIGLCLEIYKVRMGSWSYPEPAYAKVLGVPLYSGFMYASVASYICQAWRRFDLEFTGWPGRIPAYGLAAAIYLNFFTHHFLPDLRWVLTGLLFVVFGKAWVAFKVDGHGYRMPVVLSYLLIGFFIWVAENISTFFGAWQYPDQEHVWRMVHLSKISSWFLLVIISVTLVVNLKGEKERLCNRNVVAESPDIG